MKLAGAIIIYNPDDDLVDNILTYIDGIEKLFIKRRGCYVWNCS